jgi:hypothetical protein
MQARLAELEAILQRNADLQAGFAMGGSAMTGHTISSFTMNLPRALKSTSNIVTETSPISAPLQPWSLEKILKEKDPRENCTVLVIDTSSGINWERLHISRHTTHPLAVRQRHAVRTCRVVGWCVCT